MITTAVTVTATVPQSGAFSSLPVVPGSVVAGSVVPTSVVPTSVVAATAVLAVALLVVDGYPGRARLRGLAAAPSDPTAVAALRPSWVAVGAVALGALAWVVGGAAAGVLVGAAAAGAGAMAARRSTGRRSIGQRGSRDIDVGELAGRWDLLAVLLESGLPLAVAVAATAEPLGGDAGLGLRRVAGLLELGADPGDAWRAVAEVPTLAAFARAAGRSAGTGARLAQVARAEGARIRAELTDTAQARAQRAAVLITGPLGLCFLPAFLVLGIAPVVVGLAGEALAQW